MRRLGGSIWKVRRSKGTILKSEEVQEGQYGWRKATNLKGLDVELYINSHFLSYMFYLYVQDEIETILISTVFNLEIILSSMQYYCIILI